VKIVVKVVEKFYCRTCVSKKGSGGSSTGSGSMTASKPTPTPAKDNKTSGGGSGYGSGGRSTSAVAPPTASGPGTSFYTYDAIKDSKSLPAGVDSETREMYLADDVFLKMFKMDKATFGKLPVWKKNRLKQKVGL